MGTLGIDIQLLYYTEQKNTDIQSENWMEIPRVHIYISDFLRHHASMTYAHFLWRKHCPTENGFKASVAHSIYMGWAVENFEVDSQNSSVMFLHNSVYVYAKCY